MNKLKKNKKNNTDLSWFNSKIWNLHLAQKLQNSLCKQDDYTLFSVLNTQTKIL